MARVQGGALGEVDGAVLGGVVRGTSGLSDQAVEMWTGRPLMTAAADVENDSSFVIVRERLCALFTDVDPHVPRRVAPAAHHLGRSPHGSSTPPRHSCHSRRLGLVVANEFATAP